MKILVPATIRGTGSRYTDGRERWTVDVRRRDAGILPPMERGRKPVELVVEGASYEAGMRTTGDHVYITAPLKDRQSRKTNLRTVLENTGLAKNQTVFLELERVGDLDRIRLFAVP